MQTLESLQRKIDTSHDLLSVVKTMKSLAAVNIRRYESAAEAMDSYYQIVEKGWEALVDGWHDLPSGRPVNAVVCLVLGSDQGMCGQFNETVVSLAGKFSKEQASAGHKLMFWTAGERVLADLEEEAGVEVTFSLPNSISAIGTQMQKIVETFAQWRQEDKADSFYIIHNRQGEYATGYSPVLQRVLPLDRQWLDEKRNTPWPSRCLPLLGLPEAELFEQLLHQYLFASIFRAFAQSMASENAARLAAMQAAEKNIVEMEERLQGSYREARQNMITSELLDIVSGFEAIMEK